MRIPALASAALALALAAPASLAGSATFFITHDPADVPGDVVHVGALPGDLTAFYNGTRIGQSVESAREYNFMGTPIPMGFRSFATDEIANTYFPGFATPLAFRYDQPVAAAGAYLRGVFTAGINPSFGANVNVYDETDELIFTQLVEFPEGGASVAIFVGVVSDRPNIKTIEFAPPSIGGIGLADLRPGGPAVTDCPGDTNGDGVVNFIDLNNVLSDFGMTAPGLAGDVDHDGDCDFVDLNILLSAFGTTC